MLLTDADQGGRRQAGFLCLLPSPTAITNPDLSVGGFHFISDSITELDTTAVPKREPPPQTEPVLMLRAFLQTLFSPTLFQRQDGNYLLLNKWRLHLLPRIQTMPFKLGKWRPSQVGRRLLRPIEANTIDIMALRHPPRSSGLTQLMVTMFAGFQVVEGAILGCQLVPPVSFLSPGWLQWRSLQWLSHNVHKVESAGLCEGGGRRLCLGGLTS